MPGTTGFSPRSDGRYDVTCREHGVVATVDAPSDVSAAISKHVQEAHGGFPVLPTRP